MSGPPEVWLRGDLSGVPAAVMPVAHSLLQVREEIEVVRSLSPAQIAARPGGVASIAFHLKHIAGSLDRLMTYAEGRSLDEQQMRDLEAETVIDGEIPSRLVDLTRSAIDRALARVTALPLESLYARRSVGRAQLPSTVVGLLFHAAEHAQRHAGQLATTARIVRQ
jgi:uncharacterized damage-inducible protein DinB